MLRAVLFPRMTEKTIHFDNAFEAAELTGAHSEILTTVEQALDVQLVSRDTWMRLEGEQENVAAADRFFQCLRKARNRGVALPQHSILFTLEAFQQGDLSITGQASGVFVLWGLSVDVILAEGVTIITRRPIGFMYEASFGGMSFKYRSI